MTRTLLLFAVLLAGSPDASAVPAGRETYVAVFLVRGSVAGANRGEYGVFRREATTGWERLTRSNVISFGIERTPAGRLYLAAGNGLHSSTDGGRSWRILTGWETMEIMHVVVDPARPERLYVGTPWGVYRSTDDGASWEQAMAGMNRWFISDMAVDAGGVLYASSEDDLYRSADGGDRWRPMGVGRAPVNVFALRPDDSGWILAGIEDGGIRLTTDGGRRWTDSRGLEGASVYALAFSPDGTTAYAAGWQTGLWSSADGGRGWQKLWDAPGIESIFTITVDPLDARHLMVGTDGQGVYESTDGGGHWVPVGLDGGKIKDITISPVQ